MVLLLLVYGMAVGGTEPAVQEPLGNDRHSSSKAVSIKAENAESWLSPPYPTHETLADDEVCLRSGGPSCALSMLQVRGQRQVADPEHHGIHLGPMGMHGPEVLPVDRRLPPEPNALPSTPASTQEGLHSPQPLRPGATPQFFPIHANATIARLRDLLGPPIALLARGHRVVEQISGHWLDSAAFPLMLLLVVMLMVLGFCLSLDGMGPTTEEQQEEARRRISESFEPKGGGEGGGRGRSAQAASLPPLVRIAERSEQAQLSHSFCC